MSSLFKKICGHCIFGRLSSLWFCAVYLYKHKRQGIIVAMVSCLCSFTFLSCHNKKTRPNGLVASFLVDIPTRWEPRAKQSRTVALLTALRAAALFEPCTVPL